MVPQGWKLVPNNSTTDMRIAYQRARDEGFEPAYRAMLAAAPQPPAVQRDTLTREQIRDVFLANGFTIKEGLTDLKPYVYDAAYALLARIKANEGQSHG